MQKRKLKKTRVSFLTIMKWRPHIKPSGQAQNTATAPEKHGLRNHGANAFHSEKGRRNVWPVEPVEELTLKETNWESVTSITILR